EMRVGGVAGSTQLGRVTLRDARVLNSSIVGSSEYSMWIGGMIGSSDNFEITQAVFSGSVSGAEYVGGIIGSGSIPVANTGVIARSVSLGSITASVKRGGGIAGSLSDSQRLNQNILVKDSYSRATVAGANEIAGLVGYHRVGRIEHSYFNGEVQSDGNLVAGIVNRGDGSLLVLGSFFNQTINGSQSGDDYNQGRSDEQLREIQTFIDAGWDIRTVKFGELPETDSTWLHEAGQYPMLRMELQ
ncbi:MAG: hypothetical protein KDD42_06975, partial [Bdellovibrionales bacterium]|nr:hypothetical protein [Bdellovibrionales bacterium]